MPGIFNSESGQVAHDSQGLRVTVLIADDSTSTNNNNTANDSTLAPTNNNYADDLTSTVVEKCTYIRLFRARCRHISSQNVLKTP